jgi:hypothetical protein
MRKAVLPFAAATLLFCSALSACGGARGATTESPASEAVQAYLGALRGDDARAAYAMLSTETRAQVSFEEFEQRWNETRPEREHQARALDEGLRGGQDLGERTRVRYADGKRVSLRREGAEWKLETGLVSQTHAGGPRDAIRILAEALVAKNYDRVMRILTDRRRSSITRNFDGFVTSLQKHVNDEIAHISKDRAELQWDDDESRYKIVLRREGGEWRVDDVHIRPIPPDRNDPAGLEAE